MRRYVGLSLADAERLFESAMAAPIEIEDVEYPFGCTPPRGHLRFVAAHDGGLVLHAQPADYAGEDFATAMLFGAGVFVCGTPEDLVWFCNSPLAASFGLPPTEPALAIRASGGTEVSGGVLTATRVEARLARTIRAQPAALARLARVVCAHAARVSPSAPATIMLIGPTGTGKTSTLMALPEALSALGLADAGVLRVDCNELTDGFQVSRLIGSPPGYVGYDESRPFLETLRRLNGILLLDEVDKAHPDVVERVLLNLLDTGRLSTPGGEIIDARRIVVALTSNLGIDALFQRLGDVPLEDYWRVDRICRDHLVDHGTPPELVGRIGAFAVFRPLPHESEGELARVVIRDVAAEYGCSCGAVDVTLVDVVLDLARGSRIGVRAHRHVARELLAEAFVRAAAEGVSGEVRISAGPPIAVEPLR